MSLFHCGVNSDCPFAVVHLAGLEFPKVTQRITGYGEEQQNSELVGVVHELDEARLKAIDKSLSKKVVRTTNGKRARSFLLTKDNKHFRPQEGDVSLGEYIYCRPVEHDPQKDRKFETVAQLKAKNESQGTHLAEADDTIQDLLERGRAKDAQLASQADELKALREKLEGKPEDPDPKADTDTPKGSKAKKPKK